MLVPFPSYFYSKEALFAPELVNHSSSSFYSFFTGLFSLPFSLRVLVPLSLSRSDGAFVHFISSPDLLRLADCSYVQLLLANTKGSLSPPSLHASSQFFCSLHRYRSFSSATRRLPDKYTACTQQRSKKDTDREREKSERRFLLQIKY